MIHTTNPIIKHKAGLLNLAEELGNVSKACKVMGVSRDTFYRYQELVADGGIDNLIDKSRRKPNTKNRVDDVTEKAVIEYLAINDIDHTKTKAMSPQTNGTCERFHKTILNEFYQVTFRKKLYSSLEELQKDLDDWIKYDNNERTHQDKMCLGRTPLETLLDGKTIWAEKNLAKI